MICWDRHFEQLTEPALKCQIQHRAIRHDLVKFQSENFRHGMMPITLKKAPYSVPHYRTRQIERARCEQNAPQRSRRATTSAPLIAVLVGRLILMA